MPPILALFRPLLLLGLLVPAPSLLLGTSTEPPAPMPVSSAPTFGLVLHGGAGTLRRSDMTPAREAEYRAALAGALAAGYAVLDSGGAALDAVETVIVTLEDCPLFNAGKGAVFTHEGTNELDASLMRGDTGQAGAVAGVKTIRNPIRLARRVMEASPHVLLAGAGAEAFADGHPDIVRVDPSYYFTQERWDTLQEQLQRDPNRTNLSENPTGLAPSSSATPAAPNPPNAFFSTVGCVALDRHGNLAAGTSTGGMTNKRFGRVGDAPIIGAGTWAANATCAISATGHGEFFIRNAVAHDIAARMAYGRETLEAAARTVVHQTLEKQDARGGIIAIDARGHITAPFNTEGMYRAWRNHLGDSGIAVF